MSINYTLEKSKTGLIVIDVQDRLFKEVERACETLLTIQKVLKAFEIFEIPIIASEQYPKGLGPTIATIKTCLNENQTYFPKTTFSCLDDSAIKTEIHKTKRSQWVLIGIEAHVCVLQTAKSLLKEGHQVIVLNDAITSRSIFDFSTAIAEMRDCGARITSAETILFELMKDSKDPHFKSISSLIKGQPVGS
jgi:nicotinamidase-related amidase